MVYLFLYLEVVIIEKELMPKKCDPDIWDYSCVRVSYFFASVSFPVVLFVMVFLLFATARTIWCDVTAGFLRSSHLFVLDLHLESAQVYDFNVFYFFSLVSIHLR